MYWVTLPAWFWIGYYLFILMILSSSIFNIFKKKNGSILIHRSALYYYCPDDQLDE